mmetsp:Transcript_40750/g.49613  ORF Transcript_40750/g.49613 Transcript_40750/m.49613 type:complete len:462 (-) Transcript_40750:79-1464(-)|eukprot:CAMPEP_0172488292 /NCGR_PEP_ID=MMETSP1066-20121228/17753_1 /TAXON_ID=671091 /ORGANISM="Coscinodiscus wailesii, Strain CCMP2513" /LENGTH=461 /DNA_ID=CAMNT_0013255419 /DNA_START=153 /DNA_END=1538 /DNA_ORIENTATION=+
MPKKAFIDLLFLSLSLLLPAFTTAQVEGWEFTGGPRRKIRFGLNAAKQDALEEPTTPQIVIADEAQDVETVKQQKNSHNIFKIKSRDEFMKLPDRFSVLDFTSNDDFAASDDVEEEHRQSESAWWGRLYLEGFPRPFQYFRAHFGVPPMNDTAAFVMADPPNMCDEDFVPVLYNNDTYRNGMVVVALRGECSFAEKTLLVHTHSNASGILFINTKKGNTHPSGPEAHDVTITAAMISQYDGDHLIDALSQKQQQQQPVTGRFVPVTCIHNPSKTRPDAATCEPPVGRDRRFVASLRHDGLARIVRDRKKNDNNNDDDKDNRTGGGYTFSFQQAEFGSRVIASSVFTLFVPPPTQRNACGNVVDHPAADDASLKGKAVLVTRGDCHFSVKAQRLADAGAAMMILSNTNSTVFRMGIDHGGYDNSTNIRIGAVMVGNDTGVELMRLADERGDGDVVMAIMSHG